MSYFRSEGKRQISILAFLTLLVGLSYVNGLHNSFVGDDIAIIARNRSITSLKEIPGLLTTEYWANYRGPYEAGPPRSSGLYRPLPLVSYAVNYALGGLNPLGYHLGNLFLHLFDSWLLYLVAVRIGFMRKAAFAAAAIFAVHPLHTEAVTGIVGRAELLMGAGFLGAVWGHLTTRRLLALASFSIGLLAKEQAIMLPVLLLVYDASVFRSGSGHWSWRDWWVWLLSVSKNYSGYFAVLLGYVALRAAVLGGFPLPPVNPLENPLFALSGLSWFLTTMKVAGMYMALFLWPASLVADYSSNAIPAAHSFYEPAVLWGMVAWGGMLGLAGWSFGRASRVFFSVAICILTFLPASNLVVGIGTIMAERLFYLPSAGLCLLVGLGYERLAAENSRFRLRVRLRPRLRTTPPSTLTSTWSPLSLNLNLNLILRVVLVIVCLALAVRTAIRNRDWIDGERLYRTALDAFPANAKAHGFLATALMEKGRYQAALDAYDVAMKLNPQYSEKDAYFNVERGNILFKLRRIPEAVEAFEQAVTLDPKWGQARNQLGLAYALLGKFDKAETVFRYALTVTPESPDLYSNLSLILNDQGRFQEALATAEAALKRDPAHPWGLVNRAMALEGMKQPEEARAIYEQALALHPSAEFLPALEEARARLTAMDEGPAARRCQPGLVGCKRSEIQN